MLSVIISGLLVGVYSRPIEFYSLGQDVNI